MNPFIKPVPIKLDCDRSLLLTMNAMMEYQALMGHSVKTALERLQPALTWTAKMMAAQEAAAACNVAHQPVPERDLDKLGAEMPEFPLAEMRALLYLMLKHEWTQTPPVNPPLTIEQVGDLIPMQALGAMAVMIFAAMIESGEKKGANGQDPLLTAEAMKTPIGLQSAPSPATISDSGTPSSVS